MLYIFDLDDTLIYGHIRPSRPFNDVTPLPGREAMITSLLNLGHVIAIFSNQGGAAFGYHTVDDAYVKFAQVRKVFKLPLETQFAVCFAHDKASLRAFKTPEEIKRRKPGDAMIWEIIEAHKEAANQGVIIVGDRDEDRGAALAAMVNQDKLPALSPSTRRYNIQFVWTHNFFGDPITSEMSDQSG